MLYLLAGAASAATIGQIGGDRRARAFLSEARPAAIGVIFGSAVPLARALAHPWQYVVLAGALLLLLALRRPAVLTLLAPPPGQ